MGGVDKGDTIKNFLKTLAENNRLGILEGVCDKFVTLMGAARGEVDLIVTSASVCFERFASIRAIHKTDLTRFTLEIRP